MNRQRHAPTPAKASRALRDVEVPGRFRMPPKHDACGKRRCATYEQAVAYLLWLARKSKDPLRVYECDGPTGCGGWHLTKRPEWKDPTDA